MDRNPQHPDPALYARAQSLFMAALSLAPEDRAQFLDRAAGGHDPAAIAEARELLRLLEAAPQNDWAPFLDSLRDPASHPVDIAGYPIVRVLGMGGMGRVLLARNESQQYSNESDREADSLVAIKVLHPGLLSEQAASRFRTEIAILEKLRHPNIVRFLDSGTADGVPPMRYLVLEYVDGLPLLEHCQSRTTSDRERLQLLARVCEGVGHAHERGIVHRDLKPSNILVTADGTPKVLDFGLARVLHPAVQTVTQVTASGMLMGTLRYMSPEQARGTSDEIGPPSDVYSLGVLGFELMTQRLPYSIAGEETLARILAAILTEEPSTIRRHRPDLPPALDRVFAHALARTPAERYPNAEELADDLYRYLRAEAVHAPRPPRRRTARMSATRVLLPAVAMLAVLTVVVGGTMQILRKQRNDQILRSAIATLSEVEGMRHPEPDTREEIRHLQTLLAQAGNDLDRLPQSDYIGHLRRFAAWRLGECYYWLGTMDLNVQDLERAAEIWKRAMMMPFDYDIGEHVPSTVPFRASIVGDSKDVPRSGAALVSDFLASMDRPRINLSIVLGLRGALLEIQKHHPLDQFTHEQQKKIDPNQNPGLGMTLHGYGSAWMRYGAVVDSIETVRYGLFFLAAADTVVEFRDVRDPYSAFLRDYSRGYLIKAEFSRSLSDTDSALAYARRVLPWCDARVYPQSHAATQRVIAETRLLRATLVPDRAQAREELAAARQALDPAWTCVDSTQTRELLRLAILEARWNRIHAEVGLPRAAGDEDWLDRADERLQEAEGYLKSIDFPVPRAGLRLEEARVAVARARLDHSDESRGAADSLIRDCETIVPEADWPRYHHEIADLAAELARIGG